MTEKILPWKLDLLPKISKLKSDYSKAERWDGCADCVLSAVMHAVVVYMHVRSRRLKNPQYIWRGTVCVCKWIITWEYDDIISSLKQHNLNQSQSRRTDQHNFFIPHIFFHLTLDLMLSSVYAIMRKMMKKTQMLYQFPFVCVIVKPHWGT